MPASVQPGDQLVLVITANIATTATTPAGWTQLGSRQDGAPDMTSWAFTRTAIVGTAGSTVALALGASAKSAVTLVAYAGAQPAAAGSSSVISGTSANLATPAATVASSETVVVSYWADKTSGNTSWTVPASVTTRTTSIGTGGGRITAAIGDSISGTGTWPGATATSTTAGSKGIGWTIVLPPAGTPTNQNPVASFTAACSQLACTFNATGSTDDGTITGYAWNFGDGTTGTGATPAHTYTTAGSYTVTLTVTDNNNATGTTTRTATPTTPTNQNPVASFTAACSQLACTFNATGSTDDGTITGYAWNFGDGTTGTGATPAHTYTTAGSYTVTLTATDNNNATGTTTRTATPTTPTNQNPVASFTAACSQLACTFNATGSTDDGTITGYAWNFGDGTTGTGATPAHTYTTAGSYTVTLTVTDNNNATGTTGSSVTVTATGNTPPIAQFTSACDGLVCTFDGSGSSDDGSIVSYAWDFGDGDAATGALASNNFPFPGTYVVRLTVTDNGAATTTVTRSLSVSLPTVANIDLPPDVPRRDLPFIGDGEITDLEYIGNRVFVVGDVHVDPQQHGERTRRRTTSRSWLRSTSTPVSSTRPSGRCSRAAGSPRSQHPPTARSCSSPGGSRP